MAPTIFLEIGQFNIFKNSVVTDYPYSRNLREVT